MLAEAIKREANRIKIKYQTNDPYEVCRAMNITVSTAPMGTNEGSCKGFFLVNARRKIAVINSDLPAHIQRIILPHELGHGVLHWSPSLCTFHETSILNETNRIEYEANIFAAEFMMSDDDVLESLQLGLNLFQTASALKVPPELLDFKLRLLQKENNRIVAPYIGRGDFLKRNLDEPLC